MIGEREVDGEPVLTLASDAEGGIEAAFAPGAGMVCCSLRHRGEELLGQRGGLRRDIEQHSTMGVPLLHPWANRLGSSRFSLAGREVDLGLASPPPAQDSTGLPIHGLLAAAPGWTVLAHEATAEGGALTATFDFAAQSGLLAAFPFPHEILMIVSLRDATLSLSTTVIATGDASVPVAFGFHPYLSLPGVDREDWAVEIPVFERLVLDERSLPTGERERVEIEDGPLGARTFDDAFAAPTPGSSFALTGGGRRIELGFGEGYPFAQVYAPADDAVIAYEPMTAPTNALLTGGPDLLLLRPGERYRSVFSIAVADT